MKNFTKLLLTALVAVFSVNMFAEKFVLDLTNPTNPESWTWTEKNYWTETYNETDYTYWESQVFAFAHLTEGKSYGGTYYDGFTVSKNASDANMTSVEGGWTENQWGCMAKGGIVSLEDGKPVVSADKPYIIGYYSSWNMVGESLDIIFNTGETYNAVGVYVTNHPWAYYDVTVGEGSASKLDQEGDYFKIIATGMLNGSKTNTAEFMLAEVKDGELNAVKDWEWFDLSALGEVDEIYFTLDGSDQSSYGLNTASYFCMDLFTVDKPAIDDNTGIILDLNTPSNPESWTWTEKNYWADTYKDTEYETEYIESQVFALTRNADPAYNFWYGFTASKNASDANMETAEGGWVANQWGCMAKGGITSVESGVINVSADKPYLVGYAPAFNGPKSCGFIFNDGETHKAKGTYVTNHPWAYYNVTVGDASTRKLDQEGDYFKLIVTGYLNGQKTGSVDFMLAEFKEGVLKVVTDWTWLDLSDLGEVDEVYFTVDGTDQGSWGLNTAAYFCMDRLIVEGDVPTVVEEKTAENGAEGTAYRIGSTIYGIAEGAQVYVYNLGGQLIINKTVNGGSITLPTAAPYYITKIVTESGVQTVR